MRSPTSPRPLVLLRASPLDAPTTDKFRKSVDAIPGQYIVVLKDDTPGKANVPEVAQAHARQQGSDPP